MRPLYSRGVCMVSAICALALATPLSAQRPAPEIKGAASLDSTRRLIRDDSAGNCARASRALRTTPSREDQWAIRLAPRCGKEGGRALAAALQSVSESKDSAVVSSVFAAGIHFDDAALFEAHLRTATRGTATSQARVLALRNALSQISAVNFLFDPVDMAKHGAGCMPARFSHGRKAVGDALPSGAARQLEALATRLAESAQEPAAVRLAAQCAAAKAVRYAGFRRP